MSFEDRTFKADGWALTWVLWVTTCLAQQSPTQWVPPVALRDVPVRSDCKITRHGVGVSIQPTLFYPHGAMFLCPEREREIETGKPGASRFFLVREYGP